MGEQLGKCGTDEVVGSGHPPWGHPQKESCREWHPIPQLREQRDRTSYWETLHDERVESLEAERDTWRQRAEKAEEVVGDLQNRCERYDEFLESTLPADWSKRLTQAEAEAEDYGNALVAAERTIREQRERADELERERDTMADAWAERVDRVSELESLLLDMGGYIGSDLFIRAANAHDMNVKCAQLTTDLDAAERTVREQREANGLLRSAIYACRRAMQAAGLTQTEVARREVYELLKAEGDESAAAEWYESALAALSPLQQGGGT